MEPSFIIFCFLFLAGIAIENPPVQFFLLNFSALFLLVWVFLYLRVKKRIFNISYIILVSHFGGIAFLLYYLLTAKDDVIFNNEYQIHIYDHVPSIVLSNFIPIISVFLVSLLVRKQADSAFEFLISNVNPSPLLIKFTLFIGIVSVVFLFPFWALPRSKGSSC